MRQEQISPPGSDGALSYQDYFDAVPGLVCVMDRNLKIVQCNDLFRSTLAEPGDRCCYEVLKRRKDKCPNCPVEEAFQTGKGLRSESVVIDRHGKEVPVMVYTSPIKDESGDVTRVMQLAADISDVRKLQRKLFLTQQKLQNFFDEVPCYVSVQDRKLNLVAYNRRFQEDFGGEVGEHCYEVYKHRSEPCLECPVARTFEDGRSHQSEEIVTSMSGAQYNVLVHTAPIRNGTGEIVSVMEMSTNITPLRKLQSQLESTGLLISSISHSIKGLLTGLDGGMYLVNSGLNKEDRGRIEKGWEMVTRNVEAIRSTVLNILYYAKEREPRREKLRVVDLVEEVVQLAGGQARKHGIELHVEVSADSGAIAGDRMALRSMLVNLLENSLDACRVDHAKKRHRVTLAARTGVEGVEFEVADNGIGMDQETREKIFSLFFSSKGMEGTGLGLFISHNIAKAHGGTIAVESEVGRGTRFTAHLPTAGPVD